MPSPGEQSLEAHAEVGLLADTVMAARPETVNEVGIAIQLVLPLLAHLCDA